MASNSNPEEARKAQDVEAPVHHMNDKSGTYLWGRGGEGNMMTVWKNGEKKDGPVKTERSGSFRDKLEKGKEMLGMGKGKSGEGRSSGSAIADD